MSQRKACKYHIAKRLERAFSRGTAPASSVGGAGKCLRTRKDIPPNDRPTWKGVADGSRLLSSLNSVIIRECVRRS